MISTNLTSNHRSPTFAKSHYDPNLKLGRNIVDAVKLAYVDIEVLHAGLSDHERVTLVNRFNDPKDSLMILIIVFQVSAQGVNLNKCCYRVLIVISAMNAFSKIQTYCRSVKVSQKKSMSIIRMLIENSHDQYRDFKQFEKALIDLITRFFSFEVKTLLVQLLNEINRFVQKTHDSAKEQVVLSSDRLFEIVTLMNLQDDSDIDFKNQFVIETKNSSLSARKRKAFVRFITQNFDSKRRKIDASAEKSASIAHEPDVFRDVSPGKNLVKMYRRSLSVNIYDNISDSNPVYDSDALDLAVGQYLGNGNGQRSMTLPEFQLLFGFMNGRHVSNIVQKPKNKKKKKKKLILLYTKIVSITTNHPQLCILRSRGESLQTTMDTPRKSEGKEGKGKGKSQEFKIKKESSEEQKVWMKKERPEDEDFEKNRMDEEQGLCYEEI